MIALHMQRNSPFGAHMTEDVMEITSEMDRGFEAGEDIDIDLDVTGANQGDEEDEYMIEDNTPLPDDKFVQEQDVNISNDDEMVDDGNMESSAADRSSIRDENLEDAEYIESIVEETVPVTNIVEAPSEQHSEFFANEEQTHASRPGEQAHREQDDATSEHHDQSSDQQISAYDYGSEANPHSSNNGQKDMSNSSQGKSSLVLQGPLNPDYEGDNDISRSALATSFVETNTSTQEALHDSNEAHADGDPHLELPQIEAANGLNPNQITSATGHGPEKDLNEASPATDPGSYDSDDPATVEGTDLQEPFYVHPVIVMYQDNEISLFPPINQDDDTATYFLQNEQLASEPVTKLLEACRTVLGESISSQEELVIDIEELSLRAGEFAPESSTTTLTDLIDIYVQLQHCDGLDEPPALYIQLTTQPNFSRRLEFLLEAVREEKGLSQLRACDGSEVPVKLAIKPIVNSQDLTSASNHPSHDSGTTQQLQEEKEDEEHANLNNISQNTITGLTSRSTTSSATAPQDMSNAASIGQTFEHESKQLDSTAMDEVAERIIASKTRPSQSAKTVLSSPLAQPSKLETQGQDQSHIDDGDSIDYEDGDVQTHEASSGSVTLQGDTLDPAIDRGDAISAEGLPQGEPAVNANLRVVNGVKEEVHLSVGHAAEMASTHPHDRPSDHFGKRQISTDFPENRNETSSGSQYEQKESQETPEPSNNGGNGGALSIPFANDTEDTASIRRSSAAANIHNQISQEQESRATSSEGVLETASSRNERIAERDDFELDQAGYGDAVLSHHGDQADSYHFQEDTESGEAVSTLVHGNSNPKEFQQKNELESRIPSDDVDQDQDYGDEITYEDDEDQAGTVDDPFNLNRHVNSNPGTLKRSRSLSEDAEDAENLDIDLQDAKRVRSG